MLVTVSLLNTVSSCQFFLMVSAAFLTIFFWPSVFAFTYLAEHLSNMLIQLLKKLSQCFAILERVTWNKSNKLSNIVKIMYVILHHLGFRKYPGSCDLDQK